MFADLLEMIVFREGANGRPCRLFLELHRWHFGRLPLTGEKGLPICQPGAAFQNVPATRNLQTFSFFIEILNQSPPGGTLAGAGVKGLFGTGHYARYLQHFHRWAPRVDCLKFIFIHFQSTEKFSVHFVAGNPARS